MATASKPLLVYDGRCAFCLLWIERWKRTTGDSVEYAAASEAGPAHPAIPPEAFRKSVVLVNPDGSYLTGALAAITALRVTVAGRRLLAAYNRVPGFSGAAEGFYRMVAGHRDEMYLLTRAFWGRSAVPPGFSSSGWLFLRALALVYGIAFASCFVQLPGLIGSNGISPVSLFLDAVYEQLGRSGPLYYPTLAWFDPGDGFLSGLCAAGAVSAGMLFAGLAPRLTASLCWLLYLSLAVAGQMFFRYPGDRLLLEAGFLAIFFTPGGFARTLHDGREPPRAARWLLWLLLFRLMFMSGVGKLATGDPHWWDLSALAYHYETQPLPTPLAWFAFQLPPWIHRLSTLGMFCVEVGAPFLAFTPRRARHAGAFLMAALQLPVALTGNFGFLNLLTLALCLTLLDDGVTGRLVPGFLRRPGPIALVATPAPFFRRPISAAAFWLMAILNLNQVAGVFVPRSLRPAPVAAATAWASRFGIVDGYGPPGGAVTGRPELSIEGSDDRREWKPYGFRYKPGDPGAPLRWVAPHQPRLDRELWSAARGSADDNGWITNLGIRLLEGSPGVLGLLGDDPFPGRPPRYVRAVVYEYRFTTPDERAATGAIWTRSFRSLYLAPISLDAR